MVSRATGRDRAAPETVLNAGSPGIYRRIFLMDISLTGH